MTTRLNVSKREAVYFSNTKASGFYRVESGFIGLYQIADTGKESLLRLYGRGSYFGYRSLFTNQHYPATARAMENSVISKVNIHTFEVLQQLSPSLNKALTTEVCQELGEAERRLVQFSAFNAKNRIIDAIQHFFTYYPHYPWTYREISEYSATDVTTVIRFCKSLKQSGALSEHHRKPHPLDLSKLDSARQMFKESAK
ncbi:Anaerobic regulatory protein [Vibrio hippocampi]|uniref:Anaerobic regulatory protein n=2 Tax=Vibrio hippocampi TaxID=654686 RepID=A0ABN8DKN3_9VIBR|nr:Anaerobic regulatory protein [Vibrio hippocampi]